VLWVQAFMVLGVSHAVGDFVLQTEWQATRKHGGLGSDPEARRALLAHVFTYSLALVPAFVWLGTEIGPAVLLIAAFVLGTHLVQDDGRLLFAYMRRVKKADPLKYPQLAILVDQSVHVTILFLAALMASGVQ
jgi:Protein of unknown function (DUF3307)